MPNGHIQDPRLNQDEQPFGFLIRHTDSHTYVYAKDEESRKYPPLTPVITNIRRMARVVYSDTDGIERSFPMEIVLHIRARHTNLAVEHQDEAIVIPVTDSQIANMDNILNTARNTGNWQELAANEIPPNLNDAGDIENLI